MRVVGNAFDIPSVHITEPFVEQLLGAIMIIPSHRSGGITHEALDAMLRSKVGLTRSRIPTVIGCLSTMRLITEIDGALGRSAAGDRVRRRVRTLGSSPLAIAILRSGLMADQVRALRTTLRTESGGYVCSRSAAQSAAPQLVGLLSRMPDVVVRGRITIGRESGLELDSMWNELPPTSRTHWEDIEKRRKAIGDRAELYSMQLERSASVGAWQRITWVSRDDDTLGYDIEVAGPTTRRIEVKGSSGRDTQFLLSANEYLTAQRYQQAYEIQFWGNISFTRDPLEDFDRLISAGYPIRVHDPATALLLPPWRMEPSLYRVTRLEP